MKRIIIIFAVLCLLPVQISWAGVQNLKVSGSIRSTYIHRENFDLGLSTTADEIQDVFITNTHMRFDADLTDNISATLDLLNERAWGVDTDTTGVSTDLDINLAYVTLREMLYSPLTLVVGRQILKYGNEFIIGESKETIAFGYASNISQIAFDQSDMKSFDAVRFIFDYEPLTFDVFYAKLDSRTNAFAAEDQDEVDLYGIYGVYDFQNEAMTKIDAYFIAKIDKAAAKDSQPNLLGQSPAAGVKPDTVYTPGIRVSSGLAEGLWTSLELALQRGNKVVSIINPAENQKRKAYAVQWLTYYELPVQKEYKPAIIYEFTHTSGDSNKTDTASSGEVSRNVFTAWDRLFENQDNGSIMNSIVSLSNTFMHTVILQFYPREDLKTLLAWTGLWTHTPIYSSTETLAQPDGFATLLLNTEEQEIGYEWDLMMFYEYTEDVEFTLSLGWVIPGQALSELNNDGAFQALVGCEVQY